MEPLTITDNTGRRIEVTDLQAAITQAENFAAFTHDNPDYAAFDKERQAYWRDVHQKLLELQSKQDKPKH